MVVRFTNRDVICQVRSGQYFTIRSLPACATNVQLYVVKSPKLRFSLERNVLAKCSVYELPTYTHTLSFTTNNKGEREREREIICSSNFFTFNTINFVDYLLQDWRWQGPESSLCSRAASLWSQSRSHQLCCGILHGTASCQAGKLLVLEMRMQSSPGGGGIYCPNNV